MSKQTAFVFFVAESEYQKLQAVCPADFPFTYQQFITRVHEGIEDVAESVIAIKVYASVEEFLAWCAETKIQPNNKARAAYATVIGRSRGKH